MSINRYVMVFAFMVLSIPPVTGFASEFQHRFAIESPSPEILSEIALIGDGLSAVQGFSFINWGSIQTNPPVNGVNEYEPFPSNSWWAVFLDGLDATERDLVCTIELGGTPWAIERNPNLLVQNPQTGEPEPGLVRIFPEYTNTWKDFVKHLLGMTPQITHLQIENEAENVWVHAPGYIEALRLAYAAVQEFNDDNPGRDVQVLAAGFNLAGLIQVPEEFIDLIVTNYPATVDWEWLADEYPNVDTNRLRYWSQKLHLVVGVLSQEDPANPSFDILTVHHDRGRTYDSADELSAWYRHRMANGVHGAYDRPMWVDDMASNYHVGDGSGISEEDQILLNLLESGDEETISDFNRQQPIWLVRKSVGNFAGGFERVSIAFGHDKPDFFMPIWRYMGLFYTNHVPKPSYHTARLMVDKLDGFTNATKIAQANTNDYVYRFAFAERSDVFVAWNEAGESSIDLSAYSTTATMRVTHLVMETTIEGEAVWTPDDLVPADDIPVSPVPVFLEATHVLTVTGTVVTSKPYDGTTFAEITGATLAGTNGTEGLTLANATTGTFAQADVGTDIPVTTAMTLSGEGLENYILIQPTLSGAITPRELTVTGAVVTSRPYDGTTFAELTGATLAGTNGTEKITLANATSGTFAQTGVGTNIAVTTTMTVMGEDVENYSLTQPELTGDITPRELTVTVTKLYDGNAGIDAEQCVLVGVVGGEDVVLAVLEGTYDDGPGLQLGGSLTVTNGPTLGGSADLGNYTVATPTTGDITPAVVVTDVWVDINFTEATPGWLQTNFATIQSAIIGVAASGTVYVADGVYVEDLLIPDGKNGLTLMATGNAATIKAIETRPLPYEENPPVYNIEIKAHDVTIQGFAIESPDIPDNNYAAGMLIGGSGIRILNNTFLTIGPGDSFATAVQTQSKEAEPDIDISGLTIISNVFSSSGDHTYVGILVNDDAATDIVRIVNNDFSGNIHAGIRVQRSKAFIGGNVLVSDHAGNGVAIVQAEGNDQSGIEVVGNVVSNFSNGIILGLGNGNQKLTGIILAQNAIIGNATGVWARLAMDSDVAIASNNELANNGIQVRLSAGAGNLDFEAILASNIFDRAVVVRGSPIQTPIIFSSIQDAISHPATAEGFTIDVAKGIYPERIVVNKRLKIVGDPDDPGSVVIDGAGEGTVVTIMANLVDFKGFTVRHSGADLNNPRAGIALAGTSGCSVMFNVVQSNMNGVAVVATPAATADDNVIRSNTIAGNLNVTVNPEFTVEESYGIIVNRLPTSSLASSGNRIEENDISGSRAGIYLGEAATGTEVHRNRIFNNIHHGIELVKSDANFFAENIIHDNGVIGQGLDPAYDDSHAALNAAGVRLAGARNNLFQSNNVFNAAATGGLQVKGFRLIDADGRNPTGNTIHRNRVYGHTEGTSPNRWGVDNRGYESVTPEAVEAAGNWWGHATGPANATFNPSGEGNPVSTDVTFFPWYMDEAMTILSAWAAIAAHPASLTNTAFEPAGFTVTATGAEPLYYQWQKDGVQIEVATNATYMIDSVVVGDAGDYRCVVSNILNTATSAVASLTVEAIQLTVIGAEVVSRPYDGTTEAEITGAILSGTNGTEGLTLGNATTGVFAQVEPGANIAVTTAMAVAGEGNENYDLSQPFLTGDITLRPLSIKANDIRKGYLQTYSFDGTEFTADGLVSADTVTSVMLLSDGTEAGAPPGAYDIIADTAEGVALDNYSILYLKGTLTVVTPEIDRFFTAPDQSGDYLLRVPDGYLLVDVEGSDIPLLSAEGFDWQTLVEGVDYEVEGNQFVRIRSEGRPGFAIRILLSTPDP